MAAAGPSRVVVPASQGIRHLFTRIRDARLPSADFVRYSQRLMSILVEEGIAALPARPLRIKTPTEALYDGFVIEEDQLCAVSIMRSGDPLAEAVRRSVPNAAVGKILIQRDESTPQKLPRLFYSKLPHDIASRNVVLCDPMLATGGSARLALETLVAAGVHPSRVVFISVVASPEGIAAIHSAFPEVVIVTGEVDAGLNEAKYIVPGLGDFGDRFYGTS